MVNKKPSAMVDIAAAALARRHRRPVVKITAKGGAIYAKPSCIKTKSELCDVLNQRAIAMLNAITAAPLHCPKRTSARSLASGRSRGRYKSIVRIVEVEFVKAERCDISAAAIAA